MTKPLKFIIAGILALITTLVILYVYSMYFKFSNTKIKLAAQAAANDTTNPDKAYQFIIEGVEFIKKSPDLTKQVMLSADVDQIDPEDAIVNASLKNCYASGYLEAPANV